MIRINLLPVRAAQKKARLQGQLAVVGLALIATGVVCAMLYASMAVRISSQKKDITRIEKEIDSLKKVIGEVATIKQLQKEYQSKLDVLEELKHKKTGPVHLLDELSRVLPEKLWLEDFKETAGSISIKGIGLNEATVARFMRDLETSPYYQGVELQVTEQTTEKSGLKLQKFDLTCQVQRPASPTATASN
ncbi:MAG: PilN domain-containing protein [Syntrophotaleaceae bacterium]